MKFTKEQKQEYFKKLREEWKKSKQLSENDEVTKALFRESGLTGISYVSFYFVKLQMNKMKLEGLPYIDCKTFNKWSESGFKVKKGEHSKITGIVWMNFKKNEDDEDDDVVLYPKTYHLFHKNQVESV